MPCRVHRHLKEKVSSLLLRAPISCYLCEGQGKLRCGESQSLAIIAVHAGLMAKINGPSGSPQIDWSHCFHSIITATSCFHFLCRQENLLACLAVPGLHMEHIEPFSAKLSLSEKCSTVKPFNPQHYMFLKCGISCSFFVLFLTECHHHCPHNPCGCWICHSCDHEVRGHWAGSLASSGVGTLFPFLGWGYFTPFKVK